MSELYRYNPFLTFDGIMEYLNPIRILIEEDLRNKICNGNTICNFREYEDMIMKVIKFRKGYFFREHMKNIIGVNSSRMIISGNSEEWVREAVEREEERIENHKKIFKDLFVEKRKEEEIFYLQFNFVDKYRGMINKFKISIERVYMDIYFEFNT
jgi:hypothetical protein